MKHLWVLLVFIAVHISSSAAVVDKIVARVNQDIITLSELEAELAERIAQDPAFSEVDDLERARRDVLGGMIDNLLIIQAAHEEEIPVNEDIVNAELSGFIQKLKNSLPQGMSFEFYLESKGTTPEELNKTIRKLIENKYLVNRAVNKRLNRLLEENAESVIADEKGIKTKYRVSHIFLKFPGEITEEKMRVVRINALQVISELRNGKSFKDAAKEYSDDPANKSIGGDLGFLVEGSIPEPFDDVIPELKVDEISEPIKSDKGYHILKITEKITPDDVLYSERFKNERQRWVEQLKEKAKINIFEIK